MPKTAQHHTSTQKFTEIQEIRENIVLLADGNASIVIGITATNFALLSREEQDGKMFAYASLLNSLSFPVQILIKSKKIQIVPYLKLLETEMNKSANPRLALFIKQYRDFIENLVTVTTVLDKQFYLVISYSSMIGGAKTGTRSSTATENLYQAAKTALHTKAESVMSLVERLGLRSHILGQEELTKLFYDIYNQGEAELEGNAKEMTQSVIVQRQKTL